MSVGELAHWSVVKLAAEPAVGGGLGCGLVGGGGRGASLGEVICPKCDRMVSRKTESNISAVPLTVPNVELGAAQIWTPQKGRRVGEITGILI